MALLFGRRSLHIHQRSFDHETRVTDRILNTAHMEKAVGILMTLHHHLAELRTLLCSEGKAISMIAIRGYKLGRKVLEFLLLNMKVHSNEDPGILAECWIAALGCESSIIRGAALRRCRPDGWRPT